MKVKIKFIPKDMIPELRNEVVVEGASTVKEALKKLISQNPSLKDEIFESGTEKLHSHILIAVNDQLKGIDSEINDNDEVKILMALSGG
ncbi:MAG: MoaD/ThiS family protein [Acidobacteriota bacterium]